MELVPIFVKDSEGSLKGLFAVRYEKGQPDEFERLFDNWSDANWVFSYFLFNEEHLKHPYFDNYTIESLSIKVGTETIAMQQYFLDFEAAGYSVNGDKIQVLFKPLDPDDKQFDKDILQEAKLLVDDTENYPQPILRLYGLRLEESTFIITGGAIKITHFMQDHPDTRDELGKMERVKNWLIDNEVTTQDDINYSYYEP